MRRKDVDARHNPRDEVPGGGHDERLIEFASAKINLTLRVLGRRADGYHDIDSLVAFAQVGDRLTLAPGSTLELQLTGPHGAATGDVDDNLVVKAAQALAARVEGLRLGCFVLDKQLPVAAGLGGGSADAAAALRLLARANALALDDRRLFASARATGADVPVCLEARPRVMRGIGDVLLAPLELPALPAVLVNPGVAVATKDVFARLGISPGETQGAEDFTGIPIERSALLSFLSDLVNDLERAAIALQPAIAEVLDSLRRLAACRLSRMSGSGATCFALFDTPSAAAAAARALKTSHPAWWICATALGSGHELVAGFGDQ
jgi:4-diphosphocytidyl-2-C-methyl-D-erythritol kinase